MGTHHQLNVTLMDTNNTGHTLNVDENHAVSLWSGEALHKIAPVLFVMVTTIIGNLVLIIMITNRKTRRRKRVNVFMVNLTIADLAVAFITMTTELLEAVFRQWVLGAFLCKFLLYFQVVTLSSTTFLLTGMSIDRYQVIVRPLQSLAQRPKVKTKVVVAWFMAFVFAIPQVFIFVQVKVYNEEKQTELYYCKSAGYSAEWQRKFYFTFQTFYILLLPTGILFFCYTAIARTIWNRGGQTQDTVLSNLNNAPAHSPRMSMKRNVMSAARRRVVFMTLSVIIAYIVCLTPYFIICLIRIYSNYTVNLTNALTVSQIIFMLHSALNPILYGLFTLRAAHINFCLPSVLRRYIEQRRFRTNHHRTIIRKPYLSSFRKRSGFFRRRNNGETSVIIAHHAAKEETSFKLRNRENGKYLNAYNHTFEGVSPKQSTYKWRISHSTGMQRAPPVQNGCSFDSDTISTEIHV